MTQPAAFSGETSEGGLTAAFVYEHAETYAFPSGPDAAEAYAEHCVSLGPDAWDYLDHSHEWWRWYQSRESG